MAPASLEEALALRAERGDEATVLAGGTFLGILMNQGFLAPAALLSHGTELGLDALDGPAVAIVSGGNIDLERYLALLGETPA